MSRPSVPERETNVAGNGDVQAAVRSARLALTLLTPALWVIPIAYCVYLTVLLDIALPGRSGETIAGLTVLAALIVLFHALLLGKRQRLLAALAGACDQAAQGLHEVQQDCLRAAFLGGGVAALIDVAALPVFFCGLALMLGWVAAIPMFGALVAMLSFVAGTRASLSEQRVQDVRRTRDLSASMAEIHRERLALLGLTERTKLLVGALRRATALAEANVARRADRGTMVVTLLSAWCLAGVAAAATWLVARDAASIGALAAALLLTLFVFHPLCRIAAAGDTLAAARREWHMLRDALRDVTADAPVVALPPPVRDLDVSGVAVPLRGTRQLTLQDMTFAATAGDLVAVIGPADAGKSILLKVLAGQVPPARGSVRLDGAALNQWGSGALRRHVGFLPQLPGLMPGTVAQNIAGFAPMADPEAITRAAVAAGAHDTIVRLPSGYDTMLGDPDQPALALSVQQRIGWARALHGEPFLVLLDNPGSFQDNDGHLALRRCLAGLRARGAVTVVVGDTASVIDSANRVLVMRKGGMVDFGLKEEVRARLAERQRREAERLAEVSVCADPRSAPADASLVE